MMRIKKKKKKKIKAILYRSRYKPNNYSGLHISGTLQMNILLGAKQNCSTKNVAVVLPAVGNELAWILHLSAYPVCYSLSELLSPQGGNRVQDPTDTSFCFGRNSWITRDCRGHYMTHKYKNSKDAAFSNWTYCLLLIKTDQRVVCIGLLLIV